MECGHTWTCIWDIWMSSVENIEEIFEINSAENLGLRKNPGMGKIWYGLSEKKKGICSSSELLPFRKVSRRQLLKI